MARQRAIIRKLPTVETLGAMTVVCSDKTGTLTMNEMTVKAIITADCCYRVEGDSYEPQGNICLEGSDEPVQIKPGSVLETYLRTIDLCNDSQMIQDERGLWGITGGPTEGALKVLAAKAQLRRRCPPGGENPVRLAVQIHGDPPENGRRRAGADYRRAGRDFALCRQQMSKQGRCRSSRSTGKRRWRALPARACVVAAAYKPATVGSTTLTHDDLREGLVFLGIAGMMDPPRPEAIDAIHACQNAGIRVKMITGDHPQTAMSIGQMLGITNSSQAMTGYQLEHMDDAELAKAAVEYDIFARTSPEHKLRLVKALQDNGEVVGMTGDGVNDAPALRQADVGIAMGIKGTEVTKEAADMVLTDDNFATIASSVKEGRRVYDNLKKTILFIMPTNLAQGLLIIIALLAGNIIPLTPVLILWMNMATSATLSFGLAFEAAERNAMNRRRVKPASTLWTPSPSGASLSSAP
jgi:magnesium-transporting ATPase (P-type)